MSLRDKTCIHTSGKIEMRCLHCIPACGRRKVRNAAKFRAPHNAGVRDLVEGKRCWSSPPNAEYAKQGFRGWHERGYLPHRDEPGLTQFVTFRLADSFPESLRSEWEHLLKIENDHERQKRFEAYLDRGRGDCHLRRPEIAKLVEDNFRQFSGPRYNSGHGW